MLLFNGIRRTSRGIDLGETGASASTAAGGVSGVRSGNDDPLPSRRRGKMTDRIVKVPVRWRRRGGKRQPVASGTSMSNPSDPASSEHALRTNPMESFASLNNNIRDRTVLRDEIPSIIGKKIQKHHELWYHLAYGRPRDRRVSGGYALQPAMLNGRPLPRPDPKRPEVSGLTHIVSWKRRPRLWSDMGAVSPADGHRQVRSFDYGNADEVVLSHTQDVGDNILNAEDALPAGSPKYIFHPYNKKKVIWDLFVALLIVYGCINIPLRIGFDLPTGLGQLITDTFIDLVFFLDIVLSFRTAYLAADGEPVTAPGDIAVRYLKGSFLIDVCSTVPVDLIMLAMGGTGGLLRSTKLLRTLRLLRLARLLKLSKVAGKEEDLKNFLSPSLWALIKMLISLVFIAHCMGCMWNWLTILSSDEPTWTTTYGVEDTPWGHRYLVGVYWAFTTMTTVGYGDITSANDLERGFAIGGMIIGATVFGYIIGNVAVIMENFNVVEAIENGKMNQIKEWLYDRKFPPALADKIRRQYRYIFTEVGVFDNTEIVDAMPGVMATSLLYAQHRAVAKGVGFLSKRPPVLVGRLLRKMVPGFANSGDVLYLEHEVGGHWYILRAGTISFYVSMSPLETQSEVVMMRSLWDDGNFGLAPVILNVLNSETATATTAAELLTVRKDDLIDILRQWPEVMAELTVEADRGFQEIKKFRAKKQAAELELRLPSTLSTCPTPDSTRTTLGQSPDNLHETKLSDPPATGIANRYGSPADVPGANVDGGEDRIGAVGAGAGGQSAESKGGESDDGLIVTGCSSEEAKVIDHPDGVVDSRGIALTSDVAAETISTVEDGGRELQSKTPETFVSVTMPEMEEGDEQEGGRRISRTCCAAVDEKQSGGLPLVRNAAESVSGSPLSDDNTNSGSGGGSGREGGGEGGDAEKGEGGGGGGATSQLLVASLTAVGGGSHTCRRPECETVAAAAAPENCGRAAERLRPPPIVTQDIPPTCRSDEMDGTGSDDDNNDIDENGESVDRDKLRRCFVAKTFSPSDLGLGLRRGGGGGEGDEPAPEKMTKASLMKDRRRRRTIDKGLAIIKDRRLTVDEVLGLDEQQAMLGSVPPERLFAVTGMVHPEAPVKVTWDLWLSLVIVWSVLEVTYRLGFDQPAQGGWLVLSFCVDGLFFADMVVSLRTALRKRDGEVVVNQREIAVAYLKGWFVVDLISAVPWDKVVLHVAVGNPSAATSTRLVRSLRLARLVRLIRLFKIPNFMEEWEDNSPLGPSSVKLGRLLIIMAFSAHVNACIWYAAGLNTTSEHNWIEDYFCSVEGVSPECPDNEQSFSLYLASIYFAFTTMTTTGYGDILPNRLSVLELVVAIASEVLGATMFAWVIGNLVALVLNLDPAERNRKCMMSYLTEYIREVPLSSKAKEAIARNYAFHLQTHSVFNQPSILGDLLPHLQNQAYVFLWRSMMPKLPFFCAMEDQSKKTNALSPVKRKLDIDEACDSNVTGFVRVVLPLLRPASFAVGEIIVTPKIGTREMSFILCGEVEIRLAKGRRNYKTITLGEREYFGEMFMLLPSHVPFRGLAQVRATARSRMMTLTRNAFTTLEERHPHISDFMSKQLYECNKSPLWVVIHSDFQHEVDMLEANTRVSDFDTLETPRSPEGSFLEQVNEVNNDEKFVRSPGGSLKMRKRPTVSRSTSCSPIGVAAPREPAMCHTVAATKARRLAAGSRAASPVGR